MVADCTGQRGGVYYESGLAQGLNMPVYWTCRKDQMEGVHFDTNHFRFTLFLLISKNERRLSKSSTKNFQLHYFFKCHGKTKTF